MIKAVIIDDEKHCRRILQWAVSEQCPDVEIVAACESGATGIEAIKKMQPDLVFLDIEMRDMTGFEMLEKIGEMESEIIFTTAYDQFAINAFKVNAIDYLLKPIDEEELKKAVEKVTKKKDDPVSKKQIEFLLSKLKINGGFKSTNIAFPSSSGLEFIEIDNIIFCKSDSNYTSIFLKDAKPLVVSKTLKDVEAQLPKEYFFRVHHSYTVNLKHIKRYLKADGGYLVMSNGEKVKVARSKKDLLMELL